MDRSGIYCATSCTDKTLAIYDYHTGELMATMAGKIDTKIPFVAVRLSFVAFGLLIDRIMNAIE